MGNVFLNLGINMPILSWQVKNPRIEDGRNNTSTSYTAQEEEA
jgi:hypothetical protein